LGEKRWRVFERGLSMVNKNAFVVSTEAMDEGGMDAMRETRRKKKKMRGISAENCLMQATKATTTCSRMIGW